MDRKNRKEKTAFKAKPACRPMLVLVQPISQGPITPPSPAKVNRVPRMVLVFSVCVSETAAVIVGKIMEKKKPVRGRKKERFVSVPTVRQIAAPSPAKRIERTYPNWWTKKPPIKRPIINNAKNKDRDKLLVLSVLPRKSCK